MMNWIKVEDGYPERHAKVLVSLDGCIYVGKYLGETDEGSNLWIDTARDKVLYGVKAWMPLPEGPETEEPINDELDTKIEELKVIADWFRFNGESLRNRYAVLIGVTDVNTDKGILVEIGDGERMTDMLAEAVRPLINHVLKEAGEQ